MNFIELNGAWTLLNDNKNINCQATVPGCVHTDLLENKIIDEALAKADGVKNQAAEYLGIKRTTLIEKLKKRGL